MFELAFIEQCADPGMETAIVERFIAAVGTDNPLAITITDGNRVILPEPPATPEDAMRLIERFVGQAVVRVGVTRYPAGHGIANALELDPAMLDACDNIRMGTVLFGKVLRVVAHARDSAGGDAFTESVAAWRTGMFEDRYVFGEPDPGPLTIIEDGVRFNAAEHADGVDVMVLEDAGFGDRIMSDDPNKAGIRVDLFGLGRAD